MDLELLHGEVARRLNTIVPGDLWPGFVWGTFALYDETRATLGGGTFPRPADFRGNTAVEWEGKILAIWNMATDPGDDLDLLAAGLAHELFHVFQMERGEGRFPNDLAALSDPVEGRLLALKREENRELVRALRETDPGKIKARLARFAALREQREALSGCPCPQEYYAETVEGMAEYVGTKALKALDREKYTRRLSDYESYLTEATTLLLDTRRLAYYTGTFLLLAAQGAGLSPFHEIGAEKRPIYKLLKEQLPTVEAGPVPPFPRGEALAEEQRNKREEVLAAFFGGATVYREGHFAITGYDPMNMWLLGDKLYGSHFWLLWDREREDTLSLRGPAVLRWNGREVLGVWTKEERT